jgi:hypothetical protein
MWQVSLDEVVEGGEEGNKANCAAPEPSQHLEKVGHEIVNKCQKGNLKAQFKVSDGLTRNERGPPASNLAQ